MSYGFYSQELFRFTIHVMRDVFCLRAKSNNELTNVLEIVLLILVNIDKPEPQLHSSRHSSKSQMQNIKSKELLTEVREITKVKDVQ